MDADKNFGAGGGLDGCGRRHRAICVHPRQNILALAANTPACALRRHKPPRNPPQPPQQPARQMDASRRPLASTTQRPRCDPHNPSAKQSPTKTPYTLARWRPPTGPTSATDAGREKPTPPPMDRRTAGRPTAPREISAETPIPVSATQRYQLSGTGRPAESRQRTLRRERLAWIGASAERPRCAVQ